MLRASSPRRVFDLGFGGYTPLAYFRRIKRHRTRNVCGIGAVGTKTIASCGCAAPVQEPVPPRGRRRELAQAYRNLQSEVPFGRSNAILAGMRFVRTPSRQ